MKHIRKVFFVISVFLITTILTGCFGPTKREVEHIFNDYINMFPTEDLSFLYDKTAEGSGLREGDKGVWKMDSYVKTEDDKIVGINLDFNRNHKRAKGDLRLVQTNKDTPRIEERYPVYYDEDGIHLEDENTPEEVKKVFENIHMMMNYISLSREYLDKLKKDEIFYFKTIGEYEANYKLTPDDINVQKIKELYPNIPIDDENISLELKSDYKEWKLGRRFSLSIHLDDSYDTYFHTYLLFSGDEEYEEYYDKMQEFKYNKLFQK